MSERGKNSSASLLVEARKQRCLWIESSRRGSGAAGLRGGSATAADTRRLSVGVGAVGGASASASVSSTQYLDGSPVAEMLPSALRALDYLSQQLETHGELDVGYDAPASLQSSDVPYPTHDGMVGATAYEVLLAKLKHPSAAEVVYLLKGFVSKMEKLSAADIAARVGSEAPTERPSHMIHSFLYSRLAPKMRGCPLWCHTSEPPDVWSQTLVAIESFVHHKIAHKIFGVAAVTDGPAVAAGPGGEANDEKFAARLDDLGFVDAEHLDIKSLQAAEGREAQVVQWDRAIDKLRRMSAEFGPSAKIDMVVECSREITKVLTEALRGKLPGADDFLPAMILVVRKANPPRLLSNLSFIQEYCPQSRLMAEPGYIFTHLASAVAFLQDLDAAQLSISQADFETGLKRCREMARRGHATDEEAQASVLAETEILNDPYREIPVNEIRRARRIQEEHEGAATGSGPTNRSGGSEAHLVANDALLGWIHPRDSSERPDMPTIRSRYKFASRDAASLSLGEVEELLTEYKALVGLLVAETPSRDKKTTLA